ncbi:MAG: FimV/HubP family polar landmark protein [Neisseria sp.]|nr:FimV/HubP family polar landmark protein [Neisseria sp.]
MASVSAMAGLGGLNVQSNLGEPFSGTVTVTGEEAKILLSGGQATLSDSNLRSSVRKSGDNAIVSIRSGRPIQDPVLIFQLGVGSQARQYTAIIDPPGYAGNRAQPAPAERQAAARDRVAAVVAETAPSERTARSAERRAAPAARQPARAPARAAAPAQHSGEYTVRQGENLTAIASRVRPSGLSTYQTVQALVLANPELFREQSADKLWPGNVLNIPSADELRRLAQQGSADVPHAGETAAPEAASEPAVAAPASEPAATVTETITETVVAPASAPVAEEASEASVMTSEPVVAPAPQTAEQKPAESSETGSGLWRWLLLGGLGLIALWILSKLLGRKQKSIVLKEDADDDDDAAAAASPFDDAPKPAAPIRTEQPVVRPGKTAPLTRAEAAATMGAAAAATVAAKKAAPAEGELEMEDDFDDDIFFTEVSEAPTKSDDSINLDLGAIDQQQGGILSGAVTHDAETEQRKDADWSEIESTDSVYEPEPESEYAHVGATVSEPVAEAFDAPAEPLAERDFTPFDFEAPTAAERTTAKPLVIETSAEAEIESEPEAGLASEPEPTTDADEAWFKEIGRDTGIELQDGEDFTATETTADIAADTETIEWDELAVADDARDGAGFISESVGMTAPLEAKYELAKMYVEIGDPEAAKETLLELLEESDGAILAKAKAMLADLEK